MNVVEGSAALPSLSHTEEVNMKLGDTDKGVVLLSGGLDSTTLLYWLRTHRHPEQFCIGFDYGQRHRNQELVQAHLTCDALGLEYRVVDLSDLQNLLKSALTTEDPSDLTDKKSTVVPNRNAIMLSIAVGWANSLGLKKVYYAAHHNDAGTYPDCTADFVRSMDRTAMQGTGDGDFQVVAPFVYMTKASLVQAGFALEVPYDRTWSCYKGEELSCGECGTCMERTEAFMKCGLIDPLPYSIGIDWEGCDPYPWTSISQ
jgi:7-cyano-7-deazaguanine synthase